MKPVGSGNGGGNEEAAKGFIHAVDEIAEKVNTLQKRMNEVEQFCSEKGRMQSTNPKEKERDKHFNNIKKQQQDAAHREATAAKRMRDLLNKFSTVFKQITQHKWAWPFMTPVDVKRMGLHDYYQIIEKPMDLGTVQSRMEGGVYKNVKEIYADVRLVFKNAIKYNDEKDDVHVMAQKLLDILEEKWLQLLPKVLEEEKRQADEEAQAQVDIKRAEETAYAIMTRDISSELSEVDLHLKDIRKKVVQKCRKLTIYDKRKLCSAFNLLSPKDLERACGILEYQIEQDEEDTKEYTLDNQSDETLWRLMVLVKDALKVKPQPTVQVPEAVGGNKVAPSKRTREPSDAIAKPAVKRTKKISAM